jgi:aspartate aminotransferase
MADPFSLNLAQLKPSETVAISAECKRRKAAGEDVFDLSVGEPDFDTPAVVRQAAIEAINRGMTRYPANIGIPELRAAMASNLSLMSGGRAVNADHIVVSSGSKQSLFSPSQFTHALRIALRCFWQMREPVTRAATFCSSFTFQSM